MIKLHNFFQLVRCDNHTSISKRFTEMLNVIKGNEIQYEKQLRLLYKLIGQTRDLVDGKGEQKLNLHRYGFGILLS